VALGRIDTEGTFEGALLGDAEGICEGWKEGAEVTKICLITGVYLPPSNSLLTNLSKWVLDGVMLSILINRSVVTNLLPRILLETAVVEGIKDVISTSMKLVSGPSTAVPKLVNARFFA